MQNAELSALACVEQLAAAMQTKLQELDRALLCDVVGGAPQYNSLRGPGGSAASGINAGTNSGRGSGGGGNYMGPGSNGGPQQLAL
jgi:hypothetical protein